MKKLLTLIGATTLTVGASMAVVSCNNGGDGELTPDPNDERESLKSSFQVTDLGTIYLAIAPGNKYKPNSRISDKIAEKNGFESSEWNSDRNLVALRNFLDSTERDGYSGVFEQLGLNNGADDKNAIESVTSLTVDLTQTSDADVYKKVIRRWKEEKITFTFKLVCEEPTPTSTF